MKIKRVVIGAAVLLFAAKPAALMGAEEFHASIRAGEESRQQRQYNAALSEFDTAKSQAATDTERGLALGKQAEIYAYDLKDFASARRAATSVPAATISKPGAVTRTISRWTWSKATTGTRAGA